MYLYFINLFLVNSDILHVYLVLVVTSLPPSCTLYFLLLIFLPALEPSLHKKTYSMHVSSCKFLQHERRIKIPGNYIVSSLCAWIQHLVLSLFELYSVLIFDHSSRTSSWTVSHWAHFSIQAIPYPLNSPPFNSRSLQSDRDVEWDHDEGLTEVWMDDMSFSSFVSWYHYSIIESHQIGQAGFALSEPELAVSGKWENFLGKLLS